VATHGKNLYCVSRMHMLSMKTQALVASVCLLAAHGAAAQTIGGHVADSQSGRSIGDIRVVATQDKRGVASTHTDSAGNFYLDALRPGLYRLRIADSTQAPFLSDTLRVTSDRFVQQRFSFDATAQRVYYPHEVSKEAAGNVANRPPRYPDDLRNLKLRGEVIARFVVDTAGHFVESTFTPLPASDLRFVPAVLDALRTFAFYPAELPNRRKVRQYVFMPFQFEFR
jgi:outer membrane biosynthesis protein TonB